MKIDRILLKKTSSIPLRKVTSILESYLVSITNSSWEIIECGTDKDFISDSENSIVLLENVNVDCPECLRPLLENKKIEQINGEGYIICSFSQANKTTVILAGICPRGSIFAVYDFLENHLGVDPYEFWSERQPSSISNYKLPQLNKLAPPPLFNYRIWMDDDSDELMNYTGKKLIYDKNTWSGVVETLLRTGYNGVWLCDTLGRGEFYLDLPLFREYYQEVCPNYKTDTEQVEWLIDHAQERGLLVGCNLIFTEFNHLKPEQTHWERNKDAFIEVWKRYLTELPTRKADFYGLFSLSPFLDGSPFYGDKSASKITQEQIDEIDLLIRIYKPEAKVIYAIIRSEANAEELNFPETFIPCTGVVKKDTPYVDPDILEIVKQKKVPAGIFTHTCLGTHFHHIIQDPIPERIGSEVTKAINAEATTALVLDGQVMRNFFLNLSAMRKAIWNYTDYDSSSFTLKWAETHWGVTPAPAIKHIYDLIHKVHDNLYAYNMMLEVYMWRNGKSQPELLQKSVELLKEALSIAENLHSSLRHKDRRFFSSCVEFPVRIFLEAGKLCLYFDLFANELTTLEQIDEEGFENKKEKIGTIAGELECKATDFEALLKQEPIDKFKNWYSRENQRVFVPIRKLDFYSSIRRNIKNMTYESRNNDLKKINILLDERKQQMDAMLITRKKYHI